MALTAAKPSAAATHRNIYGYIFGPGINKGDVTSITLYDDTAPSASDLMNNLSYKSRSGGLRYYANYLLTNHQYHIIVVFNHDSFTVRRDFYLPSSWSNDQKVADITYSQP